MGARVLAIARGRFFYGWVIVGVGFAIEFIIVSLRFTGFGVFVKPMSQDLGLARAALSSVISFSILLDGLISPFVGPIMDKQGGRALMIAGAAIGGGGFAALGFVRGLWDFAFVRGVAIPLGIACAGPLTIGVAISNWFVRQRGRALAVGMMGVALGGAVLSPVAAYLISVYGWRAAWVVLGVAGVVVVIPLVALFVKRRPEDVGLLPDGDQASGVGGQGSGASAPLLTLDPRPLAPEMTWTRREALRTSTLWLTILAFGLINLGGSAIGVHLFPYLTDIGLPTATAAAMYSLYSVSTFLMAPVWGTVVDRYGVRPIGVAAFLCLGVSLALLGASAARSSLFLAYFLGVGVGTGHGGQTVVQQVLWANYFGRLSLGTVRGVAAPLLTVFSAVGPFLAGAVYDSFLGYEPAWAVFVVSYFGAAALIFLVRPPVKARRKG